MPGGADMDYPLGWPNIPSAHVRKLRALTGGATALVDVGEQVRPDQPIAERPGHSGTTIHILAGLAGRVARVDPGRGVTIEGAATIIQGIVGAGGPSTGMLHFLPRGESVAMVPIPRGSVIVFPGQVPLTLLQRAAMSGAAGIVAASVGARELEAFTRLDMSAALDGLAPDVGHLSLTLVFTEGVGAQTMDSVTYQLLTQRAGDVVLLDGTTNPRHNVRPEVLLPLPLGNPTMATPADDNIAIGARVRMIAGVGRGARGEVVNIFAHRQILPPGILTQAVRVRLEDGTSAVVPVSALERVG
jgi:hypothetical protein